MPAIFQRYWNYFLLGVLSILPIIVIVQIVIWTEQLIGVLLGNLHTYTDNYWIPALLFGLTLVFLVYLGFLLHHGRAHLVYFMESLLNKIPLLGTLYRVTQKLLQLFGGKSESKLREVVYTEYPKEGVWVPAFVVNRSNEHCILFVPTSPNPTSGFTVIVHQSKVIASRMTIEEASGFIISVGADYPKADEVRNLPR